jgi:hypothetical protein
LEPLILCETEYGKDGKAPRRFDVIETSNLSGHLGALNILTSAGSLLKDAPWSTLYMEILARGPVSENQKFEALLCGHAKTISILLGLSPVEYWTNTTAVSAVDEYLMAASLDARLEERGPQTPSRLAWKRDQHLFSHPGRNRLYLAPDALASLMHKVYQDMFKHEDLSSYNPNSMEDMENFVESSAYPPYHRGSLVAFVKAVCKIIETEREEMCRLLLEMISRDGSRMLGSNYIQAFCLDMSKAGLYSEPWLTTEIRQNLSSCSFCKWNSIPEAVAVTVTIPSYRWKPVYELALKNAAGVTFEGNLQSATIDSSFWHNIFSDVQMSFGVVTTVGSPERDDFQIVVDEDDKRFGGDACMIASFYVSSAALQMDIPTTQVIVGVQRTGQNAVLFSPMLGPHMSVFECPLQDQNHVFITRHSPRQTGYHVVGASGPGGSLESLSIGCASTVKFTAVVDTTRGDINAITGHIDFQSQEVKAILEEKAPVDVRQSSVAAIDIVLGENSFRHTLHFPIPVLKEGSKTRIARKSSYIEVIAPVADPATAEPLDGFLFPTALAKPKPNFASIPATLNIPHLNLDSLPILDVSDKSAIRFLTTFASFTFSARERALRDVAEASAAGLSSSGRLNFKESLFTMFMLASGLQGGQTGLFSVTHPGHGGIHMLFFVSALRLDGANSSVVLDAAVLPFTAAMLAGGENELTAFLLLLRSLECCNLTVNDDELVVWKKVLPALAERCRNWSHDCNCEYAQEGAGVPLSLDHGKPVLCSCGQGKLPENFVSLPEWDTAARFATRIAISPTYAVPFVEEVVDKKLMGQLRSGIAKEETCRKCGRTEAMGSGPLRRCMRCLEVKYCSAECQKKDWKKHRMECSEVVGTEGR